MAAAWKTSLQGRQAENLKSMEKKETDLNLCFLVQHQSGKRIKQSRCINAILHVSKWNYDPLFFYYADYMESKKAIM